MHPLGTRILTGHLENGRVVLSYQIGMADGITIYSKRGAEPEYSPLVEDDPGPVVDDRPKLNPDQPEIRRYHAILLYSGEENRQKSNEVVLTVP